MVEQDSSWNLAVILGPGSLLAEQMELLYNLTVDPKRHRIISYSIGSTNPSWDEYRIEYTGKDRPYWPRLIPVQSCFIETGPVGPEMPPLDKNSTIVVTRFEKDRSVVERHLLGSEEMWRMRLIWPSLKAYRDPAGIVTMEASFLMAW